METLQMILLGVCRSGSVEATDREPVWLEGGRGRDGLRRSCAPRRAQSRDGETRTHPGFKGWCDTECTRDGQPPDPGRIAWFE